VKSSTARSATSRRRSGSPSTCLYRLGTATPARPATAASVRESNPLGPASSAVARGIRYLWAPSACAAAGSASAAGGSASALRTTYVRVAEELGALARRLRAAGMSAEDVVRTVSPLRNELKLNIREQGSWLIARLADLRNLLKYGNRAGPSPDALFRQYGAWEKALEAISRTNSTVNRLTGVAP